MLTLKKFKDILSSIENITILQNNKPIPPHFHLTEMWYVHKTYIDCWWKKREDSYISMQLWVAWDIEHRLSSKKLLNIIEMSKDIIQSENNFLVVEYQWLETIWSYHLWRNWDSFILKPISTNCLAQDKCGISPNQLPKQSQSSCCSWWCSC